MLDASDEMMYDEMGGIPAFTIIKNELVRILEGLPPTALFNVAVFDKRKTYQIYPKLMPASASNISKVEAWLNPLNTVRPGMGVNEWGTRTLGKGGIKITTDFSVEKLKARRSWYNPAMLAMKQQADTVFLLTCQWGAHWHDLEERDNSEWSKSSAGKRYWEAYEKGKKMLAEENRKRAAKGEPPRVLAGRNAIMKAYFPDVPGAPAVRKYHYTPKDLSEAMLEIRQQYTKEQPLTQSGLRKKKSKSKDRFSFNVVHFLKVGESGGKNQEKLKGLTQPRAGEYQSIAGLEAIKSSISPSE
jgi:hypothetical protein